MTTINGTAGDDNLTGTSGDDFFNVYQGGNDTVSGLAGNDTVNFAAAFTAADTVNGGAGSDTIELKGDYSAGLVLGATTMTSVEQIKLADGFSYNITENNANVAAGASLTINAQGLTAGNTLTFDGSAETDGTIRVVGGAGDDHVNMGAALTAADRIDGTSGNDTITVSGDYSFGFTNATLRDIDTFVLGGGHNYHFVTNDTNVAAGATMTVDASAEGAADTLIFSGTHETDGSFLFKGGAGLTEITGGSKSDTISMGANLAATDRLNGNGSADTLQLAGNYNLVMQHATLTSIENVQLAGGFDYNLTTGGGILTGALMTVDATQLGTGDGLTFDAHKETAGRVTINAGAGAATLIGGTGNDIFNFDTVTQTTFGASSLVDGQAGADKIVLDGDYTGAHAITLTGTQVQNVETMALDAGHDYNLTISASTVKGGASMTVDASALAAANVLTFNGASAASTAALDVIGGAGNDNITGGLGADTIDLSKAGDDTASGGAGNDTFVLAGALSAGDTIDGGAGSDVVFLNSRYSTTFSANNFANVETIRLGAGHTYALTSVDANVAAGQTLTVDASALGASDTDSFNGAAETDGTFHFTGGAGNDTFTSGALGAVFDFSEGGNDKGTGGATGGSTFIMGATLNSSDTLNGGTGLGIVQLAGDYTGANALTATTNLTHIKEFDLAAGNSYVLTLSSATVTGVTALTVDASALAAANSATFNGSAATTTPMTLIGGAGNDVLTSGGGATTFDLSHGGDDTATGGAGNDTFAMANALTATDTLAGGAGNDTVTLSGRYSLTLGTTTFSSIETLKAAAGANYVLTTVDANVASGASLAVDASALGSANTFSFNGAAETDGSFHFTGGAGNDTLTAGTLGASFDLSEGGTDRATGGSTGVSTFNMGGTLDATDTINGGADGHGAITLNGDYSAGLTFGATTVTNANQFNLGAGHAYNLTFNAGTFTGESAVTIDASALSSSNALTLNASAAGAGTALTFALGSALAGADQIKGGAGSDVITLSGTTNATLTSTSLTSVETMRLAAGGSYTLTTADANVAAGQTLTVDATALTTANTLAFNGAAETDGGFAFLFGAGLSATDSLNGGTSSTSTLTLNGDYSAGLTFGASTVTNVDQFILGAGHAYNLTFNAGNFTGESAVTIDASALSSSNALTLNAAAASASTAITFALGSALAGADQIKGGAGSDVITLSGTTNATLTAASLTSVETMRLAAGGSYTLATADANVAAGHTLTVDATALTTANTLSFNGAAETDGGFAFRFTGGLNATDSLNGGTGNTSTLDLNGDYSAGLTLNGSHIANIPHITVEAGHNYNLTWTGAAPTSTFTVDGSALGASNTLALNFSAATGITAATFIGGAGNDTLTGGNGPTAFNLTQGGNDTATGGSGADTFALGTTFTNADTLSGGAGNDTVSLSGPYSLTFGAAALTSIEALQLAAGANYTLATVDANVAAGATLAIDASALGAGNVLTFDGSAETDGSFAITGGAGNDSVTGGAGADTFDMSKGGNDTVHAGDGNDTISFGSALTSADTIDGGAGSDTVALSGTNSITLAATTLTSVEALRLAAGGSYTLTTVDANVAAGQTLTVDATALAAANTLAFNGAAETDGSFAFRFGAGLNATDTLNGGASGASTLDLNGDYSAGLTLSGSHITNIPRISVEAGHNYNLTWTGAAPATFTVDGSALGASNTLAFNISGATGITAATLIGGAGNDTLTGGSAPTNFDLSHGGNDTATGGSGGDTFTMGAALTASDVLNGGAGNDVVVLNGDYGTTLKTGFNMNNFAGIETLLLTAGHSYSIVDAHDNFTTAFTVDGSTLGTGDSLNFVSDSSAGIFDLIGGAGNDNLTLGESGTIDLTLGGEDTATAAAGQTIFMGSTLDAGDKLNGGGFANVDLNGDYTGANAITLTSANLIDMGNMVLEDGHSYDITYTSAAAPGPAFVLDASALSAAQTLTASFANVTAATMITGGAGNDVITGSHDVDVDLTNGGNDTVAGAGTVYMGTTFDGNDALTNVTMLVLDGTYSGAHALNITSAANLSTAELVLQGDFNYNITVASAQIVSTLTSDGNGSVTFDGSAETTNGYTVHADSDSSATLTGGGGNDLLESSDTDTVVLHGGGGDDMLSSVINGTSSGNDVFDGGAGNDTLTLIATGNTLGTTMSAHSMTSIENLDVFNDITLNDANLAAGQTMNVTVGGTNARFLAGTETDGHFNITYNVTGTQGQIDAGALSDTITMTGTDGGTFIAGDGGADTITLSTEHDFFIGFGFVSDSTGVNYDTVNNMNFHTGDEFYYDTGSSSNAITAINTAITHGALSTATFDTDLTADLASGLSAHHAVLFTPDSGTLAGQTFIIIDVNGQTGYQSGQDFVVDITGYSGTLSKVNFDFN